MHIEIMHTPDRAVLRLEGELDSPHVALLRERVQALIDAGGPAVVLDVRRLRFLSSSGIGEMLRLTKELRRRGGEVRMTDAPRAVRKTIALVGLEGFWPHAAGDGQGKGTVVTRRVG